MPHKKNPILTENLTGLARVVRSNSIAALENVALWHERDISHSSVERVIGPDSCILAHFMLTRFRSVTSNLVVHTERMQEILDSSQGLVFSGSLLIALVDGGITREDAYRLVQKHALAAWEGGASLKDRVLGDEEISKCCSSKDIEAVFDLKSHQRHVDTIFNRALAG